MLLDIQIFNDFLTDCPRSFTGWAPVVYFRTNSLSISVTVVGLLKYIGLRNFTASKLQTEGQSIVVLHRYFGSIGVICEPQSTAFVVQEDLVLTHYKL